jgi:hypothetical protein
MFKKIILAASILASTSAIAADKDGKYMIYGIGVKTCAEYNIDPDLRHAVRNWMSGHFTALSFKLPDVGDAGAGMTGDKMNATVEAACERMPDSMIDTIVKLTFLYPPKAR